MSIAADLICWRNVSFISQRENFAMYKEFAGEVVMWLIPVVVLLGLAVLITTTA